MIKIVATRIAQEAIERGAEAIVAAGGTARYLLLPEALIGTGIPLGVIPRGTANAFATAIGIPSEIEAACQTILAGVTRPVDVAKCNGKPMLLLTGIGFEAETIDRARSMKNTFGKLAYILAGIGQLRHLDSFTAWIETEDRKLNLPASAVTVANAAPPTSVLAQGTEGVFADDGLLDITIVAPNSRLQAIGAIYHLFRSGLRNTAVDRDDVTHLRARNAIVRTEPPQKVVVDGDLYGTASNVAVTCIREGLTVFIPAPAS